MPLPIDIPGTLAQSWTELMQLLSAQGYDVIAIQQGAVEITTQQGLIEYLQQFGIQPVYTLQETLTGFAQVSAVNPADTTAVTVGTGTALTAAGGAVQDFTMNGGTTWGIVKKGIAITAAISLLVASLDATLITDLFRDDLENTATDFTIDGENIPVQIASDGKTYYQSDFLEAIRQKLVDLGVFSGGELEPITPPDSNWQIYYKSSQTGNINSNTINRSNFLNYRNSYRFYNASDIPVHDRYGVLHTGIYCSLSSTGDDPFYPDYVLVSLQGQILYYSFIFPADSAAPYGGNRNLYVFSGDGTSLGYLGFSVYGFNENNEEPIIKATSGQAINATYNTASFYNLPDNPYTTRITQYYTAALYFMMRETSAVEGVTPKSDIVGDLVKDQTKSLAEVVPNLGTAIQTATPTDEDLTHTTDWYPVSSIGVNALDDGLTSDQSATATDGLPDDPTKDEIIDSLLQALQEIMHDPNNPDQPVIPEIEVGDSGDTPPAEPPLLSGSSNGLWAIYNPTLQQVHDFGAWLWSDNIIDQITRQFKNSPIDAVIGFQMIYCTPVTGSAKIIKAGYLDSPVSAAEVVNQYVTIDCGTVTVNEYYGNALDYMETDISLYLPFIGIVPLSASVVMGSQVQIIYRIDVLTGTCLAQVKVIKENSNAVLYTYQGNCSVQIPLTGATYTGMVGALLGAVSTGISVMTGNLAGAAAGLKGTISSAAQGVGIQKSGTLGSNAGALGIRIPYMIITHPVMRMPYNFQQMEGIPSNFTVNIGSCSGFTRAKTAHVENISNATADEKNMIRDLLQEGILV